MYYIPLRTACDTTSPCFSLLTVVGMVRPERFELPTYGFVDHRSIQLSYGRTVVRTTLTETTTV